VGSGAAGHTTCVVHVASEAVDAGADLILVGAVSCSPPCDLRGHTLRVRDQAGVDIAGLALTTFDGTANETAETSIRGPLAAGDYAWVAVCPAVVKGDTSYPEASASIGFTVTPHTMSIVVWDVPSAVVAGERFRVKVGVKCSSECNLSNVAVDIHDHGGNHVGTVAVRDKWPGTTGLYVGEAELQAAVVDAGLYKWCARHPAMTLATGPSGEKISHAEALAPFGVRFVDRPEYVVKVEAIDEATRQPLGGAHVVMHPYRAVTDERGVAELRVAKGAYRLFVSQSRYATYGVPVDVTGDMTATAELCVEQVLERN
jgi:hypothetical protein